MTYWSRYDAIPIDPSRQIRILELRPGRGDELISGHLAVHEPEASGYEALSYTWGGTDGDRSITLNDRSGFAVTNNLFRALCRLRRNDATRILWIDAICINQANLYEQSQQVQLMGTIYRNAINVLVWLGDADEPHNVERSPFQPPQEAIPENDRRIIRPSGATDRVMRSFDAAISSTKPQWWTRTWIIQELVLAQNPVVCFGEFELSWSDVGDMRGDMSVLMEATLSTMDSAARAELYEHQRAVSDDLSSYIQRYRATDFDEAHIALETLRAYNDTRAGLSELATRTPHSKATDPRDRVFGYLGLWSGAESGVLKVSYEKATSEVFAEATLADMRTEGNARVLNWVRPHDAHRRGFPTWTLDFSFHDCIDRLPVFPQSVCRANGGFPRMEPMMSGNSRDLTIEAIIIDRVEDVKPLPRSALFPEPGEEQYLADIMRSVPTVDAYARFRERLRMGITGEKLADHENLDVACQSVSHMTTFTERVGVQTDPISGLFLWWTMKVTQKSPQRHQFSDLYEWWRSYAAYQLGTKSSRFLGSPSLFYRTTCGFIGKGLSSVQAGDLIVFLGGLELPAILRPIVDDKYSFVGLSWLNGAMLGELDHAASAALEQSLKIQQQIALA